MAGDLKGLGDLLSGGNVNLPAPRPPEKPKDKKRTLSMPRFATPPVAPHSARPHPANEEVDLHPEVAGKLTGIFFKEGNLVKKGSLLVKINDADLQAQIHKNELDSKLAQERLKRNEKLFQMKGISGVTRTRPARPE